MFVLRLGAPFVISRGRRETEMMAATALGEPGLKIDSVQLDMRWIGVCKFLLEKEPKLSARRETLVEVMTGGWWRLRGVVEVGGRRVESTRGGCSSRISHKYTLSSVWEKVCRAP